MGGWLAVAAYEALAVRCGWPTMSSAFRMFRARFPRLALVAWVVLTAHLFRPPRESAT